MTTSRTLLSVRLDPALAEALDEYCANTGESRSSVVQEGVTEYLVAHSTRSLSSLAEAVLPPVPASEPTASAPSSRQQRYRDYVRAKRHR